MAAWASPLNFWLHAAHRTGTKLRTLLRREDERKWEWMIPRKEAAQSAGSSDARPTQEAASSTAAKSASSDDKRPDNPKSDLARPKNEMASNTFFNDSRSVPAKGSVLLHHRPPPRRQPQKRWLQQWCSIPRRYWMELQRLQRRIQRTLDQIRDPSRQLPSRTTAILEQLRDRIQAIPLDMSALNQSCNVDSNTPKASQGPPRPAVSRRAPTSVSQTQTNRPAPKRRRRPQRRKRRSDKRPCTSTIEESSSSGDRVTSLRESAVLQGTHTTPPSNSTHPDCHFPPPPHHHLPFPRQLHRRQA